VFVLRRTLRTWPLYFATLLAAYLTLHISGTGERVNWIQHLFFLQNYAPDWVASSLGATWSLCIEEHFYIVWPLLIFLLPRRLLAWTMSGVFLSLPLLRFWGLHHDFTHKQLYSETQFHLDGLAAGSLVALLVFYYAVRPRTLKWIAYACLFVGTSCSLLGFWNGWDVVRGDNIIFGFTFLAIAFAGLLMILLDGGGPVLGRLFGFGPVRYVGRISYGIYLLHMGIFALLGRLALQRFFGEWSESWAFSIPLRIGVTIGVAALSYRFFESPILRFKDGVR
jgi:peptidoglycan/LPS O-acetylase OafA/YrhL